MASDPGLQDTELIRQAERINQTSPLPLEVHKSLDNSYTQLSGPGDAGWKLWRVCVKRGSETKCVEFLRGQASNLEHLGSWMIGLAFSRPSIPGVIYVKSESPGHIKRAFEGAHHMVNLGKTITLVPEEECNQLIRMPSIPNAVVQGGWVRIKKGHYKGDVAFVTAVKDDNVRVLVVPRILYDVCPAWTRAPPALFDADRARTIFGQDSVRQVNADEKYTFQHMTFKAGLLVQIFGMKQLISGDVYPTLEEIQLFSQSSGWDRGARDAWEADRAAAVLRERDRVQILSGEFRGALGVVVDKRSDSVQVQLSHHDHDRNVLDENFRLELSVDQVMRLFKLGDYVRVREGAHVGKCGYVVRTITGGTGLLELVEWDKSQPFTLTYEPDPPQHLSVYAHSVDFAEESICFASDSDRDELEPKSHIPASVVARASGDPISFAGRKVVVVKSNMFRGYRGVIQYTHKVHKFFGVRLDATNKIVHLPEDFLVDQLSGEHIYHFRRRPANVSRVHLASSDGYGPPIAEPTPQWESPPDSSTPAWDPSSTPRHDPDSISTLEGGLPGSLPRDIQSAEESAVCQPPSVFEDWLATVDLRGTQIIVRISGFTPQDGRGSAICDGNIASTTGKLIQTSGTSPEIEVKAMVPGARPMSIPLRFVKPVHPGGRPEEAIIFAGEYSGAVGVVGHAFGPSWEVVVFDDQDCMYFVEVPPEYMVRTVKRTIRLGGCSS